MKLLQSLLVFSDTYAIFPPTVVFPYVTCKAVVDSMPPDWSLGISDTGWVKIEFCFSTFQIE